MFAFDVEQMQSCQTTWSRASAAAAAAAAGR